MPRQIDNHNSKEYINRLRSEILAKITDEWKEKWAKNHGITDDITISSGHTVTIPSGQTGFLSKLSLNGVLINNGSLKYKEL